MVGSIHPFNCNAVKAVPTREINASEQTTESIEKTTKGGALLTQEQVTINMSKGLATNEEENKIFIVLTNGSYLCNDFRRDIICLLILLINMPQEIPS